MRHILIFSPFYPPHLGGLETYVQELSSEFITTNNTVTIFTSDIPATKATFPVSEKGLTIIYFPAFEIVTNYPVPRFWTMQFWRTLQNALQPRPDFIISNTRFFLTSLIAGFIAKWFAIPWIHIEHGSWFVTVTSSLTTRLAHWYDLIFGRTIFHSATITVAISKAVQKFVQRFDNRPTLLIYRGLNTAFIDSTAPRRPLLPAISDDTFLIVSVGRLFKWKGFEYTLQAVEALPLELQKKVVLLIAGEGEDRVYLEKHASPSIIFLGQLSYSETIALLKTADIYIHSSLAGGGLSTALLEALYCSRAVIATPHEGADEVVTHLETGLIVPAADSNAITKAITRLIKDPSLRSTLGANAHQKVQPLVSWKNNIALFHTLFDQLSNNANRSI